MDGQQPEPAPSDATATVGWHRDDAPPRDVQVTITELQLKQLGEMREIGMRLLQDLDAEGDKGEKAASVAQRAAAFDRIAKAMRQIMALEQEVMGMREKRIRIVQNARTNERSLTVRRHVDQSVKTAKPEFDRHRRERLLDDLFSDYRKFETGSIPELIAGICKDLGIPADLSLWEQPHREDITLAKGYEWVVPLNGDKPYTLIETPSGIQVRRPFDSYHFNRHGGAPPDG